MTTIEKIEKGIITLAEFTEDQQSFIRGIVKLSFNEGQEQALRIHDVVGRSEQLKCRCIKDPLGSGTVLRCCDECAKSNKF